ncbi:MAG: anhydro-N-acetylmuramic acid kinase [Candidatus Eremiobacteraeota bacterium]|nr:anhydro-N-acetylmuramic acid kinase [Candidatus Eremiobacteraeota bacterium]
MKALGMMSGTSLDGIDAALVDIAPAGTGYALALLSFVTIPYETPLSERLRSVLPPHSGSIALAAELARDLGEAYARAAVAAVGETAVDYVAMHGQTLFHDGTRGITLQSGLPYALRDAIRATVCFDFRSADCALGGHGAPLMPYVDALLLRSATEDVVAVNLGGIANLTFLPRGAALRDVIAYDTGPGNMLIDSFVFARTQGSAAFDEGGRTALAGNVDAAALQEMLSDPYFAMLPPKSTGRERFGAQFLQAHREVLDRLSLEDGAATLSALTAETVARAVRGAASPGARVVVSGGGAHNRAVVDSLKERLAGYGVEETGIMQLPGDAKEAMGFAVLGYETLRERPANLPQVTGARGPAVLGAIAPYRLAELLARVRSECTA